MPSLSAVIITFNEERNIRRCLESIKDIADEIIVIDSYSTDGTKAICAEYNTVFLQEPWGGYSVAKNYGNQKAENNFILSMDADEALSEQLKQSIIEIKNRNAAGYYKFNRLTNYCGHWIKHSGWYPDVKLRLFDRRTCHWEGLIHETIIFKTPQQVEFLKGDLLHYSYYTVEDHLKQMERYTDIASKELFEKGYKPYWWNLFINPAVKFLRDYFIKLGFLDGYYGWLVCRLSARATYLKYYKLRKLKGLL